MLRYPIFTGGVVAVSGICSACFLRKRRRCGGYPFRRYAPAPPRGSLLWRRQTFRHCQKPSPWGRWLRPAGADGRGTSRAIRFALEPQTFPSCQGLPLRGQISPGRGKMSPQVTKGGIWHRAAMTERVRSPITPARPSGIRRTALLRLLERIDREMAIVISPDPAFSAGSMRG